jgi:hypothetical protein
MPEHRYRKGLQFFVDHFLAIYQVANLLELALADPAHKSLFPPVHLINQEFATDSSTEK